MSVEIKVKPENLTGSQLVDIFNLFCKAFEIEPSERDRRFLEGQGLDCLNSQFGLDYRPYMGAKFFGHVRGDNIQFHGYSDPKYSRQQQKDEKFAQLILAYASKNRLDTA